MGMSYSCRVEVIFGDLFGTIEAEVFIKVCESLQKTFYLLTEELSRLKTLFPAKKLCHECLRVISSLTHINILNKSTIFNLLMSPFDYSVCDRHEMAILPDFTLNLFVGLGEQTSKSKYTDLINCGSINVKYTILKKKRPADSSKLERLRECDRQTKRLRFLWTKIESICSCSFDSEYFSQFTQEFYNFNEEIYIKPCLYTNRK